MGVGVTTQALRVLCARGFPVKQVLRVRGVCWAGFSCMASILLGCVSYFCAKTLFRPPAKVVLNRGYRRCFMRRVIPRLLSAVSASGVGFASIGSLVRTLFPVVESKGRTWTSAKMSGKSAWMHFPDDSRMGSAGKRYSAFAASNLAQLTPGWRERFGASIQAGTPV